MIEKPDLTQYLTRSRSQLYGDLSVVCSDLCAAYQDVATAEMAEISARVDGWLESSENTIKGREWAATINAAGSKTALADKRADLAVLNEAKWFILRLLDDLTRI